MEDSTDSCRSKSTTIFFKKYWYVSTFRSANHVCRVLNLGVSSLFQCFSKL